jgi:hypothetical protein
MSYLAVVVVVGLVIAIHECGHLLAAKMCGIPIQRFSVGFGPKLIGFRWRETSYWLSVIPLGGYVLPTLDESEARPNSIVQDQATCDRHRQQATPVLKLFHRQDTQRFNKDQMPHSYLIGKYRIQSANEGSLIELPPVRRVLVKHASAV